MKIPNWQEAKRGRIFEFGGQNSNTIQTDWESDAPTTRPRCLSKNFGKNYAAKSRATPED